MKKIEAIIRKTKFEDVKDALLEADIEWFSYYDVRGIGKARQGRIYRGVVYDTSTIERILISIVVRDKNTEKTVQAIIKAAQTGEIGDGRIFVIPIGAISRRSSSMSLFPIRMVFCCAVNCGPSVTSPFSSLRPETPWKIR